MEILSNMAWLEHAPTPLGQKGAHLDFESRIEFICHKCA